MTLLVEFETVEGFTLDDPVKGVLDNVFFTLGGASFGDISSFVDAIGIARGKNRELDRYSAGQVSIQLNNRQRTFDPLYTSGQFYGQIIPRRQLRISVDGVRQFTGVIDDWNFDYDPGGDSIAEIVATDDFTLLARQILTDGTATPQLSGARVSAVLNMPSVNWPLDRRDIGVGESTLGADVFGATTNALEYLQTVTTSEQGQLFIDKDGDLTFLDRLQATPTSTGLVTFADDGTGIPYTRVNVNYGTELLVNTAEISSAAGTAVAQNNSSRGSYGVIEQTFDTLVSTFDQLRNLADFIVRRFADPEYRFDSIEMNLDTLTTGHRATVLGLELGDVVKIIFTPNDLGDPIEQFGQIIKLDHNIQQDRHDVTIGLASLDFTFLVLDDAQFGTLDSNSLAF